MNTSPDRQVTSPDGDAAFVRWLARWALVVSVLIIVFDLAVFRNYPFPNALDGVRGTFYSVLGIGLVIASLGLAFLGYRVVTVRYQSRARDIYLLFLPLVLLVTSLVWLVLLSRAG